MCTDILCRCYTILCKGLEHPRCWQSLRFYNPPLWGSKKDCINFPNGAEKGVVKFKRYTSRNEAETDLLSHFLLTPHGIKLIPWCWKAEEELGVVMEELDTSKGP